MDETTPYIPYVFAAGRGLKDRETLSLLQSVADRLNIPLVATRGAVEEGLAEADRMIGMSGKRIRTDVYVSFGVSGSNFHTAGIRGDPYVIAVNTDPHCRIFELADCRICEDARTALERLNAYVQKTVNGPEAAGRDEMIRLLKEGLLQRVIQASD